MTANNHSKEDNEEKVANRKLFLPQMRTKNIFPFPAKEENL